MENRFRELANDSYKMRETNDCGVKALAVATGRKYKSAHKALRAWGRKNRGGTNMYAMRMAVRDLGYQMIPLKGHAMNKAKTVRTLKDKVPSRGVFLVMVKRHIFAVRGGEIHDWSEGRCHRIQEIWRVKKA